ncbi:MAG: di-trans,poly-cis-decaprenylcistransferase [Proteobacteria bacterium]|jgi:undecaprenyl diphosphate synthase|nr:di-trans,poly-cis-decaprenylcistransferase [Pseudomonadota bacterium]MBK7114719.1 di-trans,poly-cis-decaprenylcistransferase [Pseudomonadota bacterium]MBK9251020.1 di-trans,poly-cis-decaprenylcistransferase [Pseudomonadota bacterium]MCC6632446.1 di-trans,poly-cis-decaprenylcistransferase [Gammaproteobacteria bacterium]
MTLPRHVAIIMDGNGRWAAARGLPRHAGHKEGVEPVRMCVRESLRNGIGALTLFAFSSENWGRPGEEVSALMGLFVEALDSQIDELHENGVRVAFIGDRQGFPERLRARMAAAEARTAHNAKLRLQVAVGYGGRWDILNATRQLAERCASGAMRPADLSEDDLSAALQLSGLPDPDLFIRTGGERRISNFLLWNLAYTELYFCADLWPDFNADGFGAALQDFASRQRRFGLTGAQSGEGA